MPHGFDAFKYPQVGQTPRLDHQWIGVFRHFKVGVEEGLHEHVNRRKAHLTG